MPWLADLTAAILQRVLGRYVTGLDGRSLKLAVWSGRVVLERLTLRPDALLGLLPVHVRAGFVGRIVMVVPWHKLGTLPVTVELHDVHVLASPLNEELWTDEQEAAYGWAQKQAKLRAREHEVQALLERLLARSAADAAEDGSFSATLLARVVENVHLSVVGLHVRYEDRTNAGAPCALGLRLGAAHVKSVDAQGRARFVERAPGAAVRKLLELSKLSLYLDAERPTLLGELPDAAAIERAFRDDAEAWLEKDASAAEASDAASVLRPLSGRLLCEIAAPRRERPAAAADAATLVRAQVELPAAAVELTRRQYSAVLLLATYASRHRHLARRVRFGARRPLCQKPVGPTPVENMRCNVATNISAIHRQKSEVYSWNRLLR